MAANKPSAAQFWYYNVDLDDLIEIVKAAHDGRTVQVGSDLIHLEGTIIDIAIRTAHKIVITQDDDVDRPASPSLDVLITVEERTDLRDREFILKKGI